MKKEVISLFLTFCLVMTLIPASAASAFAAESSWEFVAIPLNYIKYVDEEGYVTLKIEAPEPDADTVVSLENGWPIVLAKKITKDDGSAAYQVLKETAKVTSTDESVRFYRNYREFDAENFGMYGERNDAYSVYVYNISADEVGSYTLICKKKKLQLELRLPDYGFYTKPEASVANQFGGGYRYDPNKEHPIYMIVTNPEEYRNIEFYAHTEEMADAVSLEQMGEYGEICKVTVNEPIDYVLVRCLREFNNGDRDGSGNGFMVTQKPAKSVIKSISTSTKHSVTTKWKKQAEVDGYQIKISTDSKFKKNVKTYYVKGTSSSKTVKSLKAGKKYYAKVRAYRFVNGKFYGSWSKTKSIVCK